MICSLELLVQQGAVVVLAVVRWNHQPSIAVSEQRVSVAGWLRFVYRILCAKDAALQFPACEFMVLL